MKILVVDDEAAIRGIVTRWLEAAGHESWAAVSAEQAVEELECITPAVVVSDIEMSARNGFWLAEEIGRRWPNTAVILMTGCLDAGMARRSMSTGAIDYLRKPFTRDQLVASVSRALLWHHSRVAS